MNLLLTRNFTGISLGTDASGISGYLKQIMLQIGTFHPEIRDFGSENHLDCIYFVISITPELSVSQVANMTISAVRCTKVIPFEINYIGLYVVFD